MNENGNFSTNVSEFLQLIEIQDFLIAPDLCHQNGSMEYWV